ncbi:MAG: hypothetical protein IKR40_04105 [Treponema sp.]|nr:hypothetical protein [Treponema sp.]
MIREEELEAELWKIENVELPELKIKYLEKQAVLNECQGFVSQKILLEVEMTKEEYIRKSDRAGELRNMLSVISDSFQSI